MANNKKVEYLDALTSSGVNRIRRAWNPAGRYYGFDTIAAGTGGLTTTVTHSDPLSYTDTSNVAQSRGALINKHGIVFFDETGVVVTLAANSSGDPRYQVFYMEYTWVNVEGGVTPTFGALAQVSIEPTEPPTVTAVQLPIGYFTIPDGASAWTDLTYTPYPKPAFAGNELDLSVYARLDLPNQFEATNGYGSVQIDKTAFTPNVGLSSYALNLPNTGNIFEITSVPDAAAGSILILGILDTEEDLGGEIFYIKFPNVDRVLSLSNGASPGKIITGTPGDYAEISLFGRVTTLVCYGLPNGDFQVFSPSFAEFHIGLLETRMESVENEVNSHNARLNVLERPQYWYSIKGVTTVFGDWEITDAYASKDSLSRAHLRGRLKYTGSSASGSQVIEFDFGNANNITEDDITMIVNTPLMGNNADWVNRTGDAYVSINSTAITIYWRGMDDCSSSNQYFSFSDTIVTLMGS